MLPFPHVWQNLDWSRPRSFKRRSILVSCAWEGCSFHNSHGKGWGVFFFFNFISSNSLTASICVCVWGGCVLYLLFKFQRTLTRQRCTWYMQTAQHCPRYLVHIQLCLIYLLITPHHYDTALPDLWTLIPPWPFHLLLCPCEPCSTSHDATTARGHESDQKTFWS